MLCTSDPLKLKQQLRGQSFDRRIQERQCRQIKPLFCSDGLLAKCRICWLNDQFRTQAAGSQEATTGVLPGPQALLLEGQSQEEQILAVVLLLVGDKEVADPRH